MREVSVFDIFALFLTVGECIEDKRFIFLSAVGKYNSCTLLLHMCHSWSGHVLKTRYMGEGGVPWWAWVVTTLVVRFSTPWWTARSSPLAIPPWRRLAKGFLIASPLPWRG